ncbi:hypothetical protein PSYJA_39270, partial [Pseudomonas syringae pv. japonica str. M301072]
PADGKEERLQAPSAQEGIIASITTGSTLQV